VGSLERVIPSCALKVVDQRTSLNCSCSSLGWEIASSSSASSMILSCGELFVFLAMYLSYAYCSNFFLSYSARSDSYLVQASLCCLAWCLWPSFNLFFLSLARFWLSVSPLYSRALGDILDSDSFEDLTSGALGGIKGGHRIMNTSWACVASASVTVPLELLIIVTPLGVMHSLTSQSMIICITFISSSHAI
jgi:hypothetical protein